MSNINITLPDGQVRSFATAITGMELASAISPSLAKNSVAARVNKELWDLSRLLPNNAVVEIITAASTEGIEIIRHDAAHILAQAVKELYPDVQVTIGPTIENGFYYDFVRDAPFTPDDLAKIEERMRQIVAANIPIKRQVMSRSEAIGYFTKLGESYKVEIIQSIPEGEELSIYSHGEFADLCRGPHAPFTGFVKALKLMKVAGAYWRGDSRNKMLQRIYGTAWATEAQLKNYLTMLEEAEKRDHRKLGREMNLFHFQEEAPGAVFWHTKGWHVFQTLINYMRRRCAQYNYTEISTPELLDYSIWVTSGHAEKFAENMFSATAGNDGRTYAIKPMNCPGGVQVFNSGTVSYRDLPMRVSEYGKVHRYEPSGALHGLMRVRAFTQDDAHIFCTNAQTTQECVLMCELALAIYRDFGFDPVHIKLSTRPEKRIGSDEIWDKAEEALRHAIEAAGLEYTVSPGEGAFYGPKIEFAIKDAIGRDWQMGTIQVDFNLPLRFGAYYTAEDGNKHHPVMIHRALFGSLERFIGVLLEHTSGHLPLWLAPTQVVVASITDDVQDYAHDVADQLRKIGARVELDLENDTINYKIRHHFLAKAPLIVVLGRNERAEKKISLRKLGTQAQEVLALDEFVARLSDMVKAPC